MLKEIVEGVQLNEGAWNTARVLLTDSSGRNNYKLSLLYGKKKVELVNDRKTSFSLGNLQLPNCREDDYNKTCARSVLLATENSSEKETENAINIVMRGSVYKVKSISFDKI